MRRAVWAGVLSVFCALPAAPSDTGPAASAPPEPRSARVLLAEIFERQIDLLDTLQSQLNESEKQSAELQSKFNGLMGSINSLRSTRVELQTESRKLSETLDVSQSLNKTLQESLSSSAASLSAAQNSLRAAERDRWLWAAAAMLAGVILGAVIL